MMGRQRALPQAVAPLLELIYDAYAINGKVYAAMEFLRVTKRDKVKLRLANPP